MKISLLLILTKNRLKLIHRRYDYVLLWKNREVNVHANTFVWLVVKYNIFYSTELPVCVIFFG